MQEKLPEKIVASVVGQLFETRKRKKLSHEKVAQASKLHRSTISLMEAGKMQPTLLTLLKVSNALECDLSRLLARAEKENR